jgi:hypothetical protein
VPAAFQPFCPPGYASRIAAITELIRWGPSIFSHAEFLLMLYYAERTITYGKRADASSLQQITRGIFSRRKQQWIRGPAGVSATAVKKTNKLLAERGFLVRRPAVPGEERYRSAKGNEATEYEINWIELSAEIARVKSPLGRVVTKPLDHQTTKPLGREVPNNRGNSSSEEKIHRRSASEVRNSSRTRPEPTEKPGAPEKVSALQGTPAEHTRDDSVHGEPHGDDDEKRVNEFISPKVELFHLVKQRGGFLSEYEWLHISEQLELRGIDLSEFVTHVRPHLLNPKTKNPVGMLKFQLRKYASMTRPALSQTDLQSPQVPAVIEKCPICGEIKGKGVRIVNDRLVACECATDDWRAKVEKQEEERLRQRNEHRPRNP